MNVSELQKAGGSIAVYYAAKGACELANIQRKRRELWKSARKLMKPYFPELNLKKVRYCINSSLPANWFEKAGSVEGMTFGYTIYFKHSNYLKTRRGLEFMLHELAHVDQVRRCGGEMGFAVAYGKGFLQGGSYEKNPMEIEAVNLVQQNGANLPDGVKKD